MNSKYLIYTILFFVQLVNAQESQDLIGKWSGWYEENQKSYDVQLTVERFNGIFYEGTITLIYEDKEAQFSIEGDLQKNTFFINERDMISQYAPEYITNPQWCKADYEFVFSNLGDRLQLKGIAKVPKINIAYINGVKTYNSSNCVYFDEGEIKLQRKNPFYEGDVYLEKEKEKVVYVRKKSKNSIDAVAKELLGRQPEEYEKVVIGGANPTISYYNKEEKRLEAPDSKPRTVTQEEEHLVVEKKESTSSHDTITKKDLTVNQGRKVIEAKMIESEEGTAQIKVWDNRTVDGDIISIYHNGKLVKEKINLVKEKKEFSITLDRGKNIIVMHAVNLGEIPPNSAAMNVRVGNKEYTMILTSDTKKSESVVIYYYP